MTKAADALGVILTGGMGTRLAPLTHELPKSLVPVLNRPLITYGLDLLAEAGIREIVVVVSGSDPVTGPMARQLAPAGVDLRVAVQPEPRGSGDAAICAGPEMRERRSVVLPVDAILHGSLGPAVEAFMASEADAWLVLAPTDRPTQMGIAVLEGERVVHFEEKPAAPRSNLALCAWMLGPAVAERLHTRPFVNAKGESDLSATIALMLEEGHPVGGTAFAGRWLDAGALGALIGTQGVLLADAGDAVADDAAIVDSEITGPVIVGRGARVERSALGPNVVVGAGATVRDARLVDAMVAPGATVDGLEGRGLIVAPSGAVGRVDPA